MCRTLNCFMAMSGHGHEMGGMGDIMALLSQLHQQSKKPKTNEEFIAAAIQDQEMTIRMAESVIQILKAEPPEEGAKLVALDGLKPENPEKHGFATLATYALDSGAFLVVGTDHLLQKTVSHTTPNRAGLEGLVSAMIEELNKNALEAEAAEEADEVTKKAATPDTQEADQQGTATS